MVIIAHRGKLDGNYFPGLENNPSHIQYVLENTEFDVEMDVWYTDGKFYLGHKTPEITVPDYLLTHSRTWRHAKNIEALVELDRLWNIRKSSLYSPLGHNFWHEEDTVTYTNTGKIWVHADTKPFSSYNAVIVTPEKHGGTELLFAMNLYGICTAFPLLYKHLRDEYYDSRNIKKV